VIDINSFWYWFTEKEQSLEISMKYRLSEHGCVRQNFAFQTVPKVCINTMQFIILDLKFAKRGESNNNSSVVYFQLSEGLIDRDLIV